MKKIAAFLVSCAFFLTSCSAGNTANQISETTSAVTEALQTENTLNSEATSILTSESNIDAPETEAKNVVYEAHIPEFTGLDDPDLLRYVEDSLYADLIAQLNSDDYFVENVSAVYYSKEYLEELAYNSQENIYFGYTLSELDEQFQGAKFVFDLGENGQTVVHEFEEYTDVTYDKVIKNVAIGTGVILICITVSLVSAGVGAPAVSMIFAASAKTGTMFALSSGTISGVSAGIVKGIETKNFDQAIKAAALEGSEGFKWGAISGSIAGGADKWISATRSRNSIPTPRESESRAMQKYGGEIQKSYFSKQEVSYGTPGATRPDIIREVNGGLEAIEVKNYDLINDHNLSSLGNELKRQVSDRMVNLPEGSKQRIVLDVKGRNYNQSVLDNAISLIHNKLDSIYYDIPIDIMN